MNISDKNVFTSASASASASSDKQAPVVQYIRPQSAPQTRFLSSASDVVLYGGAAGGGKSWSLLMDPLRYVGTAGFSAVLFRRTYKEIKNPGGLWDESWKIYGAAGGNAKAGDYTWEWPASKVVMSHMEHEKDRYSWQGAQIPWIGFDEVTHFSREMVMYMFSRNRSTCGVRPKIRMTCNPDSESWLREMIDWWIDPLTGLIIPERCEKVRWFTTEGEKFLWSDEPRENWKSFEFVPASLADNKLLMELDPGYLANLKTLPLVERERLLGGNWNISNKGGVYKQEWLQKEYSGARPPYLMVVQSWDTANKGAELNDPSCCTTWGVWEGGYDLLNVVNERMEYPALKAKVLEEAKTWRPDVILIEDKSSGMSLLQELRRSTGLPVKAILPIGDKITRAAATSTHFENGKVRFPSTAMWKQEYVSQLMAFPVGAHDDMVDSTSQFLGYIQYTDTQGLLREKQIQYDDTFSPFTLGGRAYMVDELAGY